MSTCVTMCPRCGSSLVVDSLNLADSMCLMCSRRFNPDLSPAWRYAQWEERQTAVREKDKRTHSRIDYLRALKALLVKG